MEVAVSAIVAVAKDSAGDLPIRAFIKKSVSRRKSQTAEAQLSPKIDAAGKIQCPSLVSRHASYDKRIFGETVTARIRSIGMDIGTSSSAADHPSDAEPETVGSHIRIKLRVVRIDFQICE